MDGLTISTAQGLLEKGQTLKEIRNGEMRAPLAPSSGDKADKTFADTLKEAVASVNTAQKTADKQMEELATGKNHNIAEVMIAADKADISLKLLVSVRNKIIEAYTEIMKMQV
jgi:flagellar hook-basal body complex protein FliE